MAPARSGGPQKPLQGNKKRQRRVPLLIRVFGERASTQYGDIKTGQVLLVGGAERTQVDEIADVEGSVTSGVRWALIDDVQAHSWPASRIDVAGGLPQGQGKDVERDRPGF